MSPSFTSLAIPTELQTESWNRTEAIARPGQRLQAYVNQVCLHTLLPWLTDQSGRVAIVDAAFSDPSRAIAMGEIVNGFAVQLDTIRLIVIPSEATDTQEFRVPQEWVDIPTWAGDYYLAVSTDTDDGTVEVWGFTTHEQLKRRGQVDTSDRTYALSGADMLRDMTVLWVATQFSSEPTRVAIAPLPSLSDTQTSDLLHQLADPAVVWPRLQVSFAEWGSLLQHDESLEALCQRRIAVVQATNEPSSPPLTRLRQWLNHMVESQWQPLEALLGPTADLAFSLRRDEPADGTVRNVKPIHFEELTDPILLMVAITPEADERLTIRVRLAPSKWEAVLPNNLGLELQSSVGEPLQRVQSRENDNSIQLKRFRCVSGTSFQIHISLGQFHRSETFTEAFLV